LSILEKITVACLNFHLSQTPNTTSTSILYTTIGGTPELKYFVAINFAALAFEKIFLLCFGAGVSCRSLRL